MTRKTAFFKGWSWFKLNNYGLALGTDLKFYTSVAKAFKLKVRKFRRLTSMFGEVTEEKLLRGGGGKSGKLSRTQIRLFSSVSPIGSYPFHE